MRVSVTLSEFIIDKEVETNTLALLLLHVLRQQQKLSDLHQRVFVYTLISLMKQIYNKCCFSQ